MKYAISLDIGSTNTKAIVLRIDGNIYNENITLIDKIKSNTESFDLFLHTILKKYSIKKDEIETIIVTGTGASFLNDSIDDIPILKVDEFIAIGYGGVLLSKFEKAIVVSIGTGTTIIESDLQNIKRVSGTGLGGGTFVGLSNAILGNRKKYNNLKSFSELVDMAKNGDRTLVDLSVGDISKTKIGLLTKDITAANFANVSKDYNENDLVAGVLNLILENVSLLVSSLGTKLPVVYIGTLVSDEHVRNRLIEIANYTKNNAFFVDTPAFAIAIGAWEYYLLKVRKVV